MRYILIVFLSVFSVCRLQAQDVADKIKWSVDIEKTAKENEYLIKAQASLQPGWHVFGQKPGDEFLIPTHFEFEGKKVELIKLDEVGTLKTETIKGVGTVYYYEKKVSFNALVRSMDKNIKGFIEFQICNDVMCLPPAEETFGFTIK